MLDSSAPVQSGDILLGRYRVEHVLGRGGMGVVVAARHLALGELFAIKFLLPAAVQHPQAVERFLREARAAARLKSEHVARVVDVGTLETGAPYMVMEHLTGSDLRELLRTRGSLPIDEAVAYVLQACDAIEEAHSLGIVHRDLKPANLFLTRRPNGSPCIKVLDFGISKQLGDESVDLTSTHAWFGSPLYMSPEQMTRAKSADTRTDIWSMGIVLYELVTATTPFLAESVTEVVGRVLQEEPVPPSRIRPDLPPWLDAAIGGCLQKVRERRFQTVRELVTALANRDVATTMPLLHAPVQPVPAMTMPLSDVPKPNSGPGSRAAQTDSAWGQTGGGLTLPRRKLGWILGIAVAVVAVAGGAAWLTVGSSARPQSAAAVPLPNDVASSTSMPTVSPLLTPSEPSSGAIPTPTPSVSTSPATPAPSVTPKGPIKARPPIQTVSSSSAAPSAIASPPLPPTVSAGTASGPTKPRHEPLD